jgi:hypothetical protein
MTQPTDDTLISTALAARIWQCSPRTLTGKLREAGVTPASHTVTQREGAGYLWRLGDILDARPAPVRVNKGGRRLTQEQQAERDARRKAAREEELRAVFLARNKARIAAYWRNKAAAKRAGTTP